MGKGNDVRQNGLSMKISKYLTFIYIIIYKRRPLEMLEMGKISSPK